MKLKSELDDTIEKINKLGVQKVLDYKEELIKSNSFKVLNTRLAFDVLNVVYSSNEIINLYNEYNCNDTHLETLMLKALKQLNIV